MDQTGAAPDISVSRPETQAQPKAALIGRLVAIDLFGAVLGLFPAYFLAVGIQAIGAVNGWWVGDSNANDGEETFATVLGSAGALIVLIGIVIAVTHYARVYGRPAILTNVYNIVAFVLIYASIWVFIFIS